MPKTSSQASYHARPEHFRVLQHKGDLTASELNYSAHLCELRLSKQTDGLGTEHDATATMRCIYYRVDEDPQRKRPISICFNGGPGSSSMLINIGALGPMRVKTNANGVPSEVAGNYTLEDNQHTLLMESDLLFIDPIGTGWSVADAEEDFFNVDADVHSIALFIRLFLHHFNRASDPIFIIGESYGTTRAVVLTEYLQKAHSLFPKGLSLISLALDFKTLFNDLGHSDEPYIHRLPAMAIAAQHHNKLRRELLTLDMTQLYERVSQFLEDVYLPFLYKGCKGDVDTMAERLTFYTGIKPEHFKKHRCRISMKQFRHWLLEDEHKVLGVYDTRVTGPALHLDETAADNDGFEPSADVLQQAFAPLFYDYAGELFDCSELPTYCGFRSLFKQWDFWRERSNTGFDVSSSLERAMQRDPKLKIQVACGHYDLITPVHAAEKTIDRMALFYNHPELRNNVIFDYYEGGHMLYTVPSEHSKLIKNLKALIRERIEPSVPYQSRRFAFAGETRPPVGEPPLELNH